MRLDNRLSLVASFVRHGSRIADIGTDHAYLPVWLVNQNICPSAIATDIRTGPSERAANNIKIAGLESKISVRLGNGLDPVAPFETDDIIIAGMGGETIAGILDSAPWTKDTGFRLILQPMTKPDFLHEFLLTNGYWIDREQIAVDGKRLYPVIRAVYNPENASAQAQLPAAFIIGGLDVQRDRLYFEKQRERLMNAAAAMRRAGKIKDAETAEKLCALLA
ncbi:MAG TPA: SAM-dependent methyltransferase [Ruminococcaceae bacterium]|nr:SAM-dependent methyltransferase [Oscillospiraceae bacterium]